MIKFDIPYVGRTPVRGSKHSAGLDIHSNENVLLPARGRKLIHTGVFLQECPIHVYLRIAPRSKLAYRLGLDVLAGVVDCDYRGEICVILYNTSDSDVSIENGDAIAQLIPEIIDHNLLRNYESDIDRGTRGTLCEEKR